MPERFPIELVGVILQEAVELFIASDRHTVVSVALTAKFIYRLVRPILFRRLVVTQRNKDRISQLLRRNEINDLVLDLGFAEDYWDPGPIAFTLKNLRCLRGYTYWVDKMLEGLPPSSQSSLRKLQLWQTYPTDGVQIPPSVTHLCLYNSVVEPPSPEQVMAWVAAIPALTHLGLDFVVFVNPDRLDDSSLSLEPGELARELEMVFHTCGANLQQLSMRLCINMSESRWQQILDALRVRARENSSGLELERKIRLWWDRRVPRSLSEDLAQSADYFLGGVDVWSEGRSLSEF